MRGYQQSLLGMQDAVALLTYCFGLPLLGSPVELYDFMADKQQEATVTDTGRVNKETVSPYSIMFAKQKKSTAWLTLKEASGYPMLGDFLLCVQEVMGWFYGLRHWSVCRVSLGCKCR